MEIVRSKSHLIGDLVVQQPYQTLFIFVLKQSGYDEIEKCMHTAFQKLDQASKINMCFGYLIKNTESNDYHFYYSTENTLPKPKVIENRRRVG